MKGLVIVNNIISKILSLSGILAGIMIVIIGFIVTWGSIARYMLISSLWVDPVSVYLFIAASFLGTAYAMKLREHVRVDIIIRLLPPKYKLSLDIGTSLLALLFFSYLTWQSFLMTMNSFHENITDLSLLRIPLWIPQSFVPLGALVLCLGIIWHIMNLCYPFEKNKVENL